MPIQGSVMPAVATAGVATAGGITGSGANLTGSSYTVNGASGGVTISANLLGSGALAIAAAWLLYFYTTFCGLTVVEAAAIFSLAKAKDWSNKDVRDFTHEMFGKMPDFLTKKEASVVIQHFQQGGELD